MDKHKNSFNFKNIIGLFFLFTLTFVGVKTASSAINIYSPGETLSPTCSPGDLNCGVSMNLDSLTNVNTITEVDDDLLFYDTDGWNRLGHGTDHLNNIKLLRVNNCWPL